MSLLVYFDEDVSAEMASRLVSDGYDVITARQAGRANRKISDEEQLAYAASVGRAIFTHDIPDYLELARIWMADGKEYVGIIVGHRHPIQVLHMRFRRFFERYPDGMGQHLRLPLIPSSLFS